MTGKEKCRILRQIRQKIADENEIKLVTDECAYKGECRGTCPKCESELAYLEAQLDKRRRMKKNIALAGISAGVAVSLAGCAVVDTVRTLLDPDRYIQGEIAPTTTEEPIDGELEPLVMGEVPYMPEMEAPDGGEPMAGEAT